MNDTTFLKLVQNSTLVEISKAVDGGANINAKNNRGATVLMWAVYKKNLFLVKYLLIKGAKVDEYTVSGNTALIIASMLGNYDIVEELLKYNPNINKTNNKGNTALIEASILFSNYRLVDLLIKKGADVNIKNKDNKSALLHLLENYLYNFKTVMLLLDNKAKVDTDNKKLKEFFKWASVYKYPIVGILIEKGVDYSELPYETQHYYQHHINKKRC